MAEEQELLADLTPAQREAVTHMEGPLLILAGAGSGKTRVITRRVAWLLSQGIRPSAILAITFTNKAADEMRQRVESLVPGNRVWISTFHSLGARLLRQYGERLGLDRNFTIYDQTDREKLVKIAMEDAGVGERFTPGTIQSAISKAKNQLLGPDAYAKKATDFYSVSVAQVYPAYEKRLRDANALDFDDLLYWPAMALKHNAELRAELDARFRYVLIDEYQDTNQAQYAIARGLSVDYPNLCVVGDPDQCLPAGTMIRTSDGVRPIEELQGGSRILAGIGWGKTDVKVIDKVMVNPYRGHLTRICVAGGIEVLATSNHVFFARQPDHSPRARQPIAKGTAKRAAAEFHGVPYDDPTTYSFRSDVTEFQSADDPPGLCFLRGRPFSYVAAANLFPGLSIPVFAHGRIVERRIEAIEHEFYDGPVYDLSVPDVHNFIANGVVVHNSIYGWRGSDIRNILDFERDFPSARVLTLNLNYRSTKAILRAADQLIAENRNRKPKDLITDNAEGRPVTLLTFDNGADEAEGIAQRIRHAVEKEGTGRRYGDFAVFVRMNALTRGLEQAFVKHRVPFQIVKGLAFFDRKENRDVLAYLRLLFNPRDDLSFQRIVNEPPRGIGKVSLAHLENYARPREMSLLTAAGDVERIKEIKGKASTGLRDFARMMRELSTLLDQPPDAVIRAVLDQSGYRRMLHESTNEEDEERLANIEELITAARQFAQEDESRTIVDFLENVTLASDVDGWDERQDCVSVMTLHAAKGLEFPVVFVAAVEQGILPHERSLQKDDQVEEERRLCFVGMTRAREELYLTHCRLRDFRGQQLYAIPSMFLEELPEDVERVDLSGGRRASLAMDHWRSGGTAAEEGWSEAGVDRRKKADTKDYDAGTLVRHERYGVGRVVEVGGHGALRKVRVQFQKGGERTFLIDKVELEIITK